MTEASKSADKRIVSSKEILARASRLLQDSQHKTSNVRQFEPLSIREASLKKDLFMTDPRKKSQKPDTRQESEDYGLNFMDIYKGQLQRHHQPDESFAKQAVSAFENGRMSHQGGPTVDDSVMSLQSIRAGRLQGFYNERTLDSQELGDYDINSKVILTYFLHALEIERLIYINKEMVEDASDLDKELEEAEKEILRLKVEKRAMTAELEEYKAKLKQASSATREIKDNLAQCPERGANEAKHNAFSVKVNSESVDANNAYISNGLSPYHEQKGLTVPSNSVNEPRTEYISVRNYPVGGTIAYPKPYEFSSVDQHHAFGIQTDRSGFQTIYQDHSQASNRVMNYTSRDHASQPDCQLTDRIPSSGTAIPLQPTLLYRDIPKPSAATRGGLDSQRSEDSKNISIRPSLV
jgi:hypothetical protein